ncbi:MAG: GNAT family N-acetyltransferase [Nocardioides sp.]
MTPPVALRPATLDDVDAITAMLDASTRHWVDRPTDADQVRERLRTPHTDMAEDTVLAELDGEVVGFGHVWPNPPAEVRSFARTHPDHRGRGVGTALQGHLVRRALDWAPRDGSPDPFLSTTTWATDPDADQLLSALGYTRIRYFQKMVLTYGDAPAAPAVAPIPGIEVRTYRPGADDDALFRAFHEAFADHFGHGDPDPLAWWRERRDEPAARYDPSLWLVAADAQGRPVGFVLSRVDDEADGNQHGYVGDVGVVPAWRGRGLGELLLRRSLADLQARGLAYSTLDVDTANASGALRLYAKVGMRRRPSFTIWRRPLTR